MTDTLHTFHRLSTDDTRGTHAFTTQDAGEALALGAAQELHRVLGNLLSYSGPILDALAVSHGEDSAHVQAVAAAFALGEQAVRNASPSAPTRPETKPWNRIS